MCGFCDDPGGEYEVVAVPIGGVTVDQRVRVCDDCSPR